MNDKMLTYRMRSTVKPIAPAFVGDAPIVMRFRFLGKIDAITIQATVEEMPDGGMTYTCAHDDGSAQSVELGWVVGHAFIAMVV